LRVALRFPYVHLNGVGGWTEFRTFNLTYFMKSCTLSLHGKMDAVLEIVTVKCLKLVEVGKQKYVT
jgi:hypothetical protein